MTDQIAILHQRINDLTKELKRVRNNSAPTVPIYDSTNFPQDGVEGQTAIAQSSSGVVGENSLWGFRDSAWHELGSAGDIRFNIYNDSGPGDPAVPTGFLDVTTHLYTSFVNTGDEGISLTDTGAVSGISLSSQSRIALLNIANATNSGIDISNYDNGGLGISDFGTGGMAIFCQTELDVFANKIKIECSPLQTILISSGGIVDTITGNYILVGSSNGVSDAITLQNTGGSILIDEQGGMDIEGPGAFGKPPLPITIASFHSYVSVGPYLKMSPFDAIGVRPGAIPGGGEARLYVFQRTSDGQYELTVDMGNGIGGFKRTILAASV